VDSAIDVHVTMLSMIVVNFLRKEESLNTALALSKTQQSFCCKVDREIRRHLIASPLIVELQRQIENYFMLRGSYHTGFGRLHILYI
jgi:hypothetical protein